jgi:ribonuclease P protein subunit RPR2
MERRGRGRRSQETDTIARERIDILFGEARKAAHEGKTDRAKRYIVLAQRIGMRYNVPLPPRFGRWVCAGCGIFLVPGQNCQTRLRPQRIVIRCMVCGHVRRIGRESRPAGKGVRKP